MIRAITKLIAPVQRRVMLMVGRCVLELINDAGSAQGVQVSLLSDEVRDNVERFQEYGFTSHPQPGSEGIVVCVGGSRDHAVVIACEDRRYRLTGLAQGEVALYDDQGQKIVLTRDGIVITAAAGKPITFDTVLAKFTGDIRAKGEISDDENGTCTLQSLRHKYNIHTHTTTVMGSQTPAPTAPNTEPEL